MDRCTLCHFEKHNTTWHDDVEWDVFPSYAPPYAVHYDHVCDDCIEEMQASIQYRKEHPSE